MNANALASHCNPQVQLRRPDLRMNIAAAAVVVVARDNNADSQ